MSSSCNSCAKAFSLLRREKGCPGCGFSYCSKCLNNKLFLEKANSEVKVCAKCKRTAESKEPNKIDPPDAYFKRIGGIPDTSPTALVSNKNEYEENSEKEIYERLQKLKEDKLYNKTKSNDNDIAERLKNLKGDVPSTSDAELNSRLAKLKGIPLNVIENKPVLPAPDTRTEQEQADDLMRQYMQQVNIDDKYEEEFAGLVKDIETRLQNLKGSSHNEQNKASTSENNNLLEDEEDIIKKIIEKAKVEAVLEEQEISDSGMDELPFCEICNEDAILRCLGCKYLFCKRCFLEHKDDDDGCNKYEPYSPPKRN